MPYPAVCEPRLVSQVSTRLRGCWNNSLNRTLGGSGMVSGSLIVFGSIISAQASDLRASSTRPMRNSQRGDSGTQARTSKVSSAGSRPMMKTPRQPI